MAVKVASEWLNSCSGCEISIVDMGERLLEVLNLVDRGVRDGQEMAGNEAARPEEEHKRDGRSEE